MCVNVVSVCVSVCECVCVCECVWDKFSILIMALVNVSLPQGNIYPATDLQQRQKHSGK